VTLKKSAIDALRSWRRSRSFAPLLGAILVVTSAMSPQILNAQNAPYVVLGKRVLLVQDKCEANKSAVLTEIGKTEGEIKASVMSLREGSDLPPQWTLVSLSEVDLQPDEKYTLVFDDQKVPGKSSCAGKGPWIIDTTTGVSYQPKNNGTGVLVSTVAFSFSGGSAPLQQADAAICKTGKAQPRCRELVLDLGGTKLPLREVAFQEVNIEDVVKSGVIANPESIGIVPIKMSSIEPLVATLKSGLGQSGTIFGFSNVLMLGSKQPGLKLKAGPFTASKAPATKDAAWLWISGTLTAGTGAAPAWVMDGKIDAPPVYEKGAFQLRAATATANIGNNKIDGQAAKDVIDFSAPSGRWIFNPSGWGFAVNLAPTYETNRALTHRNMLVTGDFAVSPNSLDHTQAVRTAKRYFQIRDEEKADPKGVPKKVAGCQLTAPVEKMPAQGDFSDCRFPRSGWRLDFHPGFEAGADLATATVKNPTTKAVVGTIPTYNIGRSVLALDGLYQYRNFSFESYFTGRYLFTTEHTAVNDKHGNPYLKTVTGAKAVNVLTATYSPGANPHIKFSIAYTNGFSAPVYQRANGIRIGLGVAY
jgi:hypothetical protein